MRILLLTSEAWNDELHPKNTMSNWFDGMENVEIATIYGSPAPPQNNVCHTYFRLSEISMVKSLYSKNKSGEIIEYQSKEENIHEERYCYPATYGFFRKLASEPIRLVRDIIWALGRLDEKKLKDFIENFSPDIIFTQRKASIKMCRIERIVLKLSTAPMVAFTGDDEYSLKQISFSPFFWIRRLWLRNRLKKNIPNYKLFFAHSPAQLSEFNKEFGINVKTLVKCGDFMEGKVHTAVHSPIVITYAGKLYCNRWRTLALLANCLKDINVGEQRIILQIYTRDNLSRKQYEALDDGANSFVMGAAASKDLQKIYDNSDILLHVEGFDLRNHLAVRYSFSTKIIDCMASGCAVMAIGREDQTGCKYLKESNSAFVADNKEDLLKILESIVANKKLVTEYARRIYEVGLRFHQRERVQNQLYCEFAKIIEESNCESD